MAELNMAGGAASASVPIYRDADYPEVLREMAEIIERQLVEVGTPPEHAAAVAETTIELIRENFGGVPVYLSKAITMRQRRRMWAMWEAFDGRNHVQLARRFGMSLSQTYRLIAVARHETRLKQQPGLFDASEATAGA